MRKASVVDNCSQIKVSLFELYGVFECSPYDYTLECQTSIQAKIHDFMTYVFFRVFAFVCFGVHIYMFCLSIVDITIDSWLIEKYSQYDKTCETPQLNCIQLFCVCNI